MPIKHRKILKKNIPIKGRTTGLEGSKYQMMLYGTFKDDKTNEIREVTSFSFTHDYLEYGNMIDEAIRHGQSLLGGSSWVLVHKRRIRYIEWFA